MYILRIDDKIVIDQNFWIQNFKFQNDNFLLNKLDENAVDDFIGAIDSWASINLSKVLYDLKL